jgi:hypothetical protein
MNSDRPIERLNSTYSTVCVKVSPSHVTRFHPLLQAGFFLRCRVGVSLRAFLEETLKLSDLYIDDKISTIFLDGKPVDDIESAMIPDGCTIALSSAMPGLVGATMRRKSFYATLRNTITHASLDNGIASYDGSVRLKLFNLVMTEIGPGLLEKGIFLQSTELKEFFADQQDCFFTGVLDARIDGQIVDPASLKRGDSGMAMGLTELKTCVSR